jgi:hypothetical protein
MVSAARRVITSAGSGAVIQFVAVNEQNHFGVHRGRAVPW